MKTNTVKFNATTRYWINDNYHVNNPIREKVLAKGIKEEVELNEFELKGLAYDLTNARYKDNSLKNNIVRVQKAVREL